MKKPTEKLQKHKTKLDKSWTIRGLDIFAGGPGGLPPPGPPKDPQKLQKAVTNDCVQMLGDFLCFSSPRVKVLFLYCASSPLLPPPPHPPPASASCSRLLHPPHSFSLSLHLGSGPPAADVLCADTPPQAWGPKIMLECHFSRRGRFPPILGPTVLLLQPALF